MKVYALIYDYGTYDGGKNIEGVYSSPAAAEEAKANFLDNTTWIDKSEVYIKSYEMEEDEKEMERTLVKMYSKFNLETYLLSVTEDQYNLLAWMAEQNIIDLESMDDNIVEV